MYEIKETFTEDMHTMNGPNYKKILEKNFHGHDDDFDYAENSSYKNNYQYLTAVYNQSGSFESK